MALSVIIFLLREIGFRATPIITVISLLLIILHAVRIYAEAIESFSPVLNSAVASGALEAMLKITGMTYLFGISSDVCRELGATSVSKVLDVVGRVEIMLIALPYVKEIIMLGRELV